MQFTKPTFIRDTGRILYVTEYSCVQNTLLYSMYSIVLSKVLVRVQSSRIHPVNLCNLFFLLYSFYDALKKRQSSVTTQKLTKGISYQWYPKAWMALVVECVESYGILTGQKIDNLGYNKSWYTRSKFGWWPFWKSRRLDLNRCGHFGSLVFWSLALMRAS